MQLKKKVVKLAAVVVVAPALMIATAGVAQADVTRGQYVSNSGHQCGAQDYITGSYTVGPVQLKQHSLIYHNCGGSTVKRKADVIADWDGPCYSVTSHRTRVLETKYVVPRSVYRGAKSC